MYIYICTTGRDLVMYLNGYNSEIGKLYVYVQGKMLCTLHIQVLYYVLKADPLAIQAGIVPLISMIVGRG